MMLFLLSYECVTQSRLIFAFEKGPELAVFGPQSIPSPHSLIFEYPRGIDPGIPGLLSAGVSHNIRFMCAVLSGSGQSGPAVDKPKPPIAMPSSPISPPYSHL